MAQGSTVPKPLQSSIDQGPYVNVKGDGMVTAMANEPRDTLLEDALNEYTIHSMKDEDATSGKGTSVELTDKPYSEEHIMQQAERIVKDLIVPVRGHIDKLSRQSRQSIWLLAYIAIITTWPIVDSVLLLHNGILLNRRQVKSKESLK